MSLLKHIVIFGSLLFCLIFFPNISFGQYTTTQCATHTDAFIAPDRNEFAHNTQPIVNEGYLHNFAPPELPCGIDAPNLTSLVINIDLLTINATSNCTGIPIFGNVLLNCPLTNMSICPIDEDVLSPGCSFGVGQTNPGLYS